ncbi:MAG: hypothetical protein M3Q03_19120 [Chloroflexota bacterium]|nr:hypothetical protein [Chloroflexota bacterium]
MRLIAFLLVFLKRFLLSAIIVQIAFWLLWRFGGPTDEDSMAGLEVTAAWAFFLAAGSFIKGVQDPYWGRHLDDR